MLITLSDSSLLVFLAPPHPFHIVLHCAPAGLSLSTYISGRYPVHPNFNSFWMGITRIMQHTDQQPITALNGQCCNVAQRHVCNKQRADGMQCSIGKQACLYNTPV